MALSKNIFLKGIARKEQKLSDIRQELIQTRQDRDQAREHLSQDRLVDHRRQQPDEPTRTAETSPDPSQTAKIGRPQPGFSLFFASDEVLKTLVLQGDVEFCAMTESGSYRAEFATGTLSFQGVDTPKEFYEMAPATVPERYHQAMQQQGIMTEQGSLTWGVTLSKRTRRSLKQIMARGAGGRLIIQGDGSVQHKSD